MSGRAHFFVALVTLASLAFIMRLVRRRQLRAKYSMLWVSVGLGLAVLAASPGVLDKVSVWIGIAYPPTTLFLVAVAFLLLIVVHFSWELSRLEERTRVLAEELALLQAEQSIDLEGTDEVCLPDDTSNEDAGADVGTARAHPSSGMPGQ